jgi:hypothetical protein
MSNRLVYSITQIIVKVSYMHGEQAMNPFESIAETASVEDS